MRRQSAPAAHVACARSQIRVQRRQARERLEAALALLNQFGERLYAERVERAIADLG